MAQGKIGQAYFDVHQLRLLITGTRALLDDLRADMRTGEPFTERVETVCAVLAVTEDKAKELTQLCGEADHDACAANPGA